MIKEAVELKDYQGWVSTRGKFHGGTTHVKKATALCKKWGYAWESPTYPDDVLMGKGWMKLSYRGSTVDIWMDKNRKPAQAQIDYIWDMLQYRGWEYFYLCGQTIRFKEFVSRVDG